MRLVITRCHLCNGLTGAKHADTINDLETIGAFITEAKRLHKTPILIDYGHTDSCLNWCNCNDEIDSDAATKRSAYD